MLCSLSDRQTAQVLYFFNLAFVLLQHNFIFSLLGTTDLLIYFALLHRERQLMVNAPLDFYCRRTHGHLRALDIRVPLLQHNTGCERDSVAWDRPLQRSTPLQKVVTVLGLPICYHLYVHPMFHPKSQILELISKQHLHLQQYANHHCACSRTLQNKKTAWRGATGSLKLLNDEAACYLLCCSTDNRDCYLCRLLV